MDNQWKTGSRICNGKPKGYNFLNKGKYGDFIFTTKNPKEVCNLIKEQIG